MNSLKEGRLAAGDFSSLPERTFAPGPFGALRRWLTPAREYDPLNRELIDRPETELPQLREELETLEFLNQRSGGQSLVLRYVKRLVRVAQPSSLRILDLGTGAADIPRGIMAWSRLAGLRVTICAVDGNAQVLELARQWSRAQPEITFEHHDLRALPYEPRSFDLVLCSLALHHLSTSEAAALLHRVQEIARLGYVINDLRRSRLAIWALTAMTRIFCRSPIVRQDGPQSCRAAFTVSELRALARQAGLRHFQIRRHHLIFRMVLAGCTA